MGAPPEVKPGDLTLQKIVAHHRRVIGSKSDQYSAMNTGSGQARFIFNSTLIKPNSRSIIHTKATSANNLTQGYNKYIDKSSITNSNINPSNNPFNSKVEKSMVQGMVFINTDHSTTPYSALEIINDLSPRRKK